MKTIIAWFALVLALLSIVINVILWRKVTAVNTHGRALTEYLSRTDPPPSPNAPPGFYWWVQHTTEELHQLRAKADSAGWFGEQYEHHVPPPPPPDWF